MVLEGNTLKVHAAVGHFLHRLSGGNKGRLLLQYLCNAMGTGQRSGEQQEHIGDHHEGVHHLEHIAEKAGQLPHLETAPQDHAASKPQNEHDGSIHRELEGWQIKHRKVEGPLTCGHQLLIDRLELLLLILPPHKSFYRPDGGKSLLNHIVQLIHGLLESAIHGRYFTHHKEEDERQNGGSHHKNQGQPGIHPEGQS